MTKISVKGRVDVTGNLHVKGVPVKVVEISRKGLRNSVKLSIIDRNGEEVVHQLWTGDTLMLTLDLEVTP